MLPAAVLLLFRIVDATLVHFGLKPNPFLESSFPRKRIAAVVANEEGELVAPGSERVAVILLGAKSNHPFGALAPEFLKTFGYLAKMNASFDRADGPGGCKFPLTSLSPFPALPTISRAEERKARW